MGNAMRKALEALAKHPRCGAHCRTTGQPCRGPAMPNGRCRMHGGKAGRKPTHGIYSKAAIEEKRNTRTVYKEFLNLVQALQTLAKT